MANLAVEIVKLLNELKPQKFNFSNLDMRNENVPKIIEQIVGKAINEQQSTQSYAVLCTDIFHYLPEALQKTFKSGVISQTQKRFNSVLKLELDQKICLGIVRFVSELFNNDFLLPKIIRSCLINLLKQSSPPTFHHLQCFELMLMITGKKLEENNTEIVEHAMTEIENVVDRCGGVNLDLNSRNLIIKMFKIRAARWEQTEQEKSEVVQQPEIRSGSSLLKQLDGVLSQVTSENMHELINGLRKIAADFSEDDFFGESLEIL